MQNCLLIFFSSNLKEHGAVSVCVILTHEIHYCLRSISSWIESTFLMKFILSSTKIRCLFWYYGSVTGKMNEIHVTKNKFVISAFFFVFFFQLRSNFSYRQWISHCCKNTERNTQWVTLVSFGNLWSVQLLTLCLETFPIFLWHKQSLFVCFVLLELSFT